MRERTASRGKSGAQRARATARTARGRRALITRVISAPWCERQRRPLVANDPLPHFHVVVGAMVYCARGAAGVEARIAELASVERVNGGVARG